MKNWFNTTYYHTLYKNRDQSEAEFFLENLFKKLDPSPSDTFLDIACGKGRHSSFINSLGYQTHGIDLSEDSIQYAKSKETDSLTFSVHDMRISFKEEGFDYCLNLFTSFGYFDNLEEDQKAITAMAKNLKKGGKLIFDFMNVKKVISGLVKEETKVVDGISFSIKRKFENNFIIKDISFVDKEEAFHFQEKVHALTLADLSSLFSKAGLSIIDIWGNYSLDDFHVDKSNRLIILAQK
jgi:SAM-dependent methyltransferase